MMFTPLHDNILVKRLDEDLKTAGGIYIPDTAKEKPSRGEVIAVGAGKMLENGTQQKMSLKKGDTILFTKWSGTEIKLDGKDFIIMKESDILGLLS
ncbi:MAG: co-chaperone GroES [Alphaproteobacteria bacterium]